MPRVFIPPALRALTEGQAEVDVPGATVGHVIENLERLFPGAKDRLCQGDALRPGLAVAVGGAISSLGLLQHTAAESEVHFLPALGGG